MKKEKYISKIEEQSNDKNTYETVNDPTNKIKIKLSKLASKLFKKNRVSEHLKYDFSSIESLATVRNDRRFTNQVP